MSAFLGVSDILPLAWVLFVSVLGLVLVQTRFRPWEFRVILASFAVHLAFTIFKLWLTFVSYGGVGDALGYFDRGKLIAVVLRQDFFQVMPQVLRMILHQDYHLDVYVAVGGESTQTISAITGVVTFGVGDSLIAVSVAFAMASFFGKVLLYQAFKSLFERKYHARLAIATLLVPSTIFWSAGIIKEAVAMVGIAIAFYAAARILGGRSRAPRITPVMLLCFGGLVVALTKAYLLITFVLGVSVWFYWRRAVDSGRLRVRPMHLVIGLTVAMAGVMLLGSIFPRYSLETIAEETADMQAYAEKGRGGSVYSMGGRENRSVVMQLLFAPFALFTALYRPLVFEAHNFQALLNALETTGLLLITLHAVRKQSLRGLWARLKRHPPLMFCLVFTVVLGVMTGLTSVNLGTLSRYRMPLVPFFVAMTLVLTAPVAARKVASARRLTPGRGAGSRPPGRRVGLAAAQSGGQLTGPSPR